MEAPPESRWLTLVKLIGGGLMTLAAVVPAMFLLWPTIQPPGPPEQLSAEIDDLQLEPHVPLARYLEREQMPTTGYSAEQLDLAGHVLRFTVTTHGFQNRTLPSHWSLHDSRTGQQHSELNSQAGPIFTPEATIDRASTDVWIPLPREAGEYFVRLELLDDKGIRLDSADSEPLVIGAEARPAERLTRLPEVQ